MKILTIENSCSQGSISLTSDGVLVRSEVFANPRGRGSEFFNALASSVEPGLDLVLVGTGPGSYNGLRASIAAAWGLACARGIRLAGICSLLGFAEPEYFVAGDARAGQWFFAHVSAGEFAEPTELLAPANILPRLQAGIPLFTTTALPGLENAVVGCPRAEILARHVALAGPAEPIYLKPPHISRS